MSKESLEEKKIKKRKGRNDLTDRNFVCECGKAYLSYPALYTHIKTKHPGRPTSDQQIVRSKTKTVVQSDEKSHSEKENVEQSCDDINNLRMLQEFLTKYFPNDLNLSGERQTPESNDPKQTFLKDIREYWQKRKKEDENTENQAYSTCIDYVLGKFLFDINAMGPNSACRAFLNQFVYCFHDAIKKVKGDQDYCKQNNAFNLPLLCNEIAMEYFIKGKYNNEYLKNPFCVCQVLYYFGRWLFNERFTNQLLKFNFLQK